MCMCYDSTLYLSSYVGKFVPRKDRTRDQGANQRYTNVYVKNFGEDFEDDDLHQAFEKFGKIYSAVVMKDETGKGRGFGFVSFENHESAARVSICYLYELICIVSFRVVLFLINAPQSLCIIIGC